MAIELHLSKTERTPWGFRLTGGADFEVPFTIIKVIGKSIAQKCGLHVGDVILKVNDVDVTSLSHSEANDEIVKAGNEFKITIFRGELSDAQLALIAEEESNEEVFNIMEGSIPIDYPERPYLEEVQKEEAEKLKELKEMEYHLEEKQQLIQECKPMEYITIVTENTAFDEHDLNLTDEEIHSIINPEIVSKSETTIKQTESKEFQKAEVISQEITTTAEIENKIEIQNNLNISELQKEEELVNVQASEVLKAVNECLTEIEVQGRKWSTFLQKPKGPKPKPTKIEEPVKSSYKVVIRTKKDLEAEKASKLAEEQAAIEAEEAARKAAEQAEIDAAEAAARAEDEAREELERNEYENVVRFDENSIEIDNYDIDECDDSQHEEKSEISKSEVSKSKEETILTLEQQLAQVKEQLSALSELPTTIQMTLGLITQQLQQIALEAQPHHEDENVVSDAENIETDDDITELLVLGSQDELSVVEEESEDKEEFHSQSEDMSTGMTEEELNIRNEEEEAQKLAEEEARRNEEEKIKKKEKMQEKYTKPLTPLERPIILPGGRRWCKPDDATRARRHPSLTDDKIDQTISSYYEVLKGNTIGINFLKYQPPPKNLDYLQKSDVYKIIHDTEPPTRGITARPEKILANEDYYKGDKSSEQLER